MEGVVYLVPLHTSSIISHSATERWVGLSEGHTGRKKLHRPALWVAKTAQHVASISLPPHCHVTALAHRTHANSLTHCELLFMVRVRGGGGVIAHDRTPAFRDMVHTYHAVLLAEEYQNTLRVPRPVCEPAMRD